MMKRLLLITLFCMFAGEIQAATPVYGRGADSGSDVAGRMLLNTGVYGRQQEADVYRGGQTFGEVVLSNANLVAYWPLNGTVSDLKSSNNLSGGTAGTYTAAGMLFNGTTQSISSAATIDLTGTNKVTLVSVVTFSTYDLTNTKDLIGISSSPTTSAGSFVLFQDGSSTGDPVRPFLKGNVGLSSAEYQVASFGWTTGISYCLAAVYDMSLATNETNLYKNGSLLTADARAQNSNNTAAFGNYTLYAGGRNNASNFANVNESKITLFNTALTAAQILELCQAAGL